MGDDIRALMHRWIDEYQSGGDVAVADELLAHDFVNHSALPGMPSDREGVKAFFAIFRHAFPDLHAVVHDMLVDGDKVVTRKTFHGIHHGEFMGIPPTGKTIAVDVIDIVRVRGGKFVEHWNVVDQLGMLQQLGAIPG
jgi:steroid delta-isomerase-like uncharacterized protein